VPFPRLRLGLGWRRKKPDRRLRQPGQVTFGKNKQPLSGPNIAGHGLPAIHEAKKAKWRKRKLTREGYGLIVSSNPAM
jgi:hypothetical protein